MISWRMAAAWVVALVVTTVLTWQIVGLADSQVGDRAVAVAPSLTTSSVAEITTTTTSPISPTTRADGTTSTSTQGTTSSSAATDSSTSSTSSTTSTTSTTAAEEWTVQTINSVGGSVVVAYQPEVVDLQAATPAPGFGVEVDDDGPDRVRVEFYSDDMEVRVEVRWDNGSLDIDIDEND